MSLIAIINILLINVIVWIALSYFWSFWTHKLFKPWAWLEQKKRKMLNSKVEKLERGYKDRVRFYAYFFAMQQVEQNETDGSFVFVGLEEPDLVALLRIQCPERKIYALGEMEARTCSVVRENCQGVITEEAVAIDYVDEKTVTNLLPTSEKNTVLKGPISKNIETIDGQIALAFIDCVEYEDVLTSLKKIYPLLSAEGLLMVHAYNHDWPGVRKAVDEFSASIKEGFVALPDMYGSICFVKNKK